MNIFPGKEAEPVPQNTHNKNEKQKNARDLTVRPPKQGDLTKRKRSSSNHHFSGANPLNFAGE